MTRQKRKILGAMRAALSRVENAEAIMASAEIVDRTGYAYLDAVTVSSVRRMATVEHRDDLAAMLHGFRR